MTFDTQSYQSFLAAKHPRKSESGFDVSPDQLNPALFPFQRTIVRWALKLGKAAVFAECGLGKTAIQLEWANQIAQRAGGRVLILAPLAVAHQTVREGDKFGISVEYLRREEDITSNTPQLIVTNYERLDKFSTAWYAGVVLDESGILKNYTGKTKRAIFEAFKDTPYKLACSATPAPNDHLELGNHAEFLDVMPSNEMISRWFINDTMEAGGYRLKHHAAKDFWRWITSWAVCISSPSDLGEEYAMDGYDLPPLNLIEHRVDMPKQALERAWADGRLMPDSNPSATGMHRVKRDSLDLRVAEALAIVRQSEPLDSAVIVWCDTNYEQDALCEVFPGALEVRGAHKVEIKEKRLEAFSDGENMMMITKPEIAGLGLNWQHARDMIFVGVSYSFESFYQAIRRAWRYGQTQTVNCHIIYAPTEGDILMTLRDKQKAFKEMQTAMNEAVRTYGLFRDDDRLGLVTVSEDVAITDNYEIHLGDSVRYTATIPDNTIDFSVYSPPFEGLYIYSASEADMGNCNSADEFFTHYKFLIKELYRATAPGRLTAVHCKDLPRYMNRDGAAGLRDFPGEIIKAHEECGWQYHSRITIWKDPVIEMQRTKNHGLLHKNFVSESNACRQGMPDYMVVFRKYPLEGQVPVTQHREVGDYIGTNPPTLGEIYPNKRTECENYSIAVWQRYASPVWYDIDQTNVLNYEVAKANDDEKHICPLQLDVIARCVDLWSMPGELIYDPFTGIGSTGYEAIRMGRKFLGCELKPEYWNLARKHLDEVELRTLQPTLF